MIKGQNLNAKVYSTFIGRKRGVLTFFINFMRNIRDPFTHNKAYRATTILILSAINHLLEVQESIILTTNMKAVLNISLSTITLVSRRQSLGLNSNLGNNQLNTNIKTITLRTQLNINSNRSRKTQRIGTRQNTIIRKSRTINTFRRRLNLITRGNLQGRSLVMNNRIRRRRIITILMKMLRNTIISNLRFRLRTYIRNLISSLT